jgi:hypothetical protein
LIESEVSDRVIHVVFDFDGDVSLCWEVSLVGLTAAEQSKPSQILDNFVFVTKEGSKENPKRQSFKRSTKSSESL